MAALETPGDGISTQHTASIGCQATASHRVVANMGTQAREGEMRNVGIQISGRANNAHASHITDMATQVSPPRIVLCWFLNVAEKILEMINVLLILQHGAVE
jgi:hypothetical protein